MSKPAMIINVPSCHVEILIKLLISLVLEENSSVKNCVLVVFSSTSVVVIFRSDSGHVFLKLIF